MKEGYSPIIPLDHLLVPVLRTRSRKLDPTPHHRVLLAITRVHAGHHLDPIEPVFPEIPTDKRGFRLLALDVGRGELRVFGGGGAAAEADEVGGQEGGGVDDGDAVPACEYLEGEESVESFFRGLVVDEELSGVRYEKDNDAGKS